jgi:hypothetical protein
MNENDPDVWDERDVAARALAVALNKWSSSLSNQISLQLIAPVLLDRNVTQLRYRSLLSHQNRLQFEILRSSVMEKIPLPSDLQRNVPYFQEFAQISLKENTEAEIFVLSDADFVVVDNFYLQLYESITAITTTTNRLGLALFFTSENQTPVIGIFKPFIPSEILYSFLIYSLFGLICKSLVGMCWNN